MRWDPITRRQLLRGMGGFTLAVPLLPSLVRGARAAAGPPRPAFIAVWSDQGFRAPQFFPNAPPSRTGAGGVPHAPLAPISGPLSPILSADFDPLRSKLNVLRGLDLCAGRAWHNDNVMLTAFGSFLTDKAPPMVASIDQVMAASPGFYATPPVARLVNVGQKDGFYQSLSLARSATGLQHQPTQTDPRAAFTQLFGGGTPPAGADAESAVQRKVVDRVLQDYRRVAGGPRIGAEDRARLEAHMTFLAEIEGRLKAGGTRGCAAPEVAGTRAVDDFVELIVAAVSCGLTRIALLKLGSANPHGITGAQQHDAHHAVTGGEAVNLRVHAYHGGKVAALLRKLDAALADPATGQTWLDAAAVYWSCELGPFWGNGTHRCVDRPVLLAGKAGGFLKTGNFVDYRVPGNPALGADREGPQLAGRPLNELLVTLLQAMGIPPADYEKANPAGDQGYGVYDASKAKLYPATWNQRRATLPIIT